jgi:hypothetical protein
MTLLRLSQLAQSGAADGDVATWDDAGGEWIPAAGGGGGGGSSGSRVAGAMSASTVTGITTTETVLTGISDVSLTVTAAHNYDLKINVDVALTSGSAADSCIIRVRDGGASAPTNASTVIFEVLAILPASSRTLTVSAFAALDLLGLSAGTHRLGLYCVRNPGTGGTFSFGSTTAGRESYLTVNDVT